MKHTLFTCAAWLCALLMVCVGLTACGDTATEPDTTTPTEANDTATTTTAPRPTMNLVDATDSVIVGEWTVEAESATITALKFCEDGTVIITTDNGVLGGSFVQNGDQLTIATTSSTMEGTFTVDGDTVVFTTASDTLTLTKAN